MNILTFDLEEWFHILDNDSTEAETQWGNYERRFVENITRITDLLDAVDQKATFFLHGMDCPGVSGDYQETCRSRA